MGKINKTVVLTGGHAATTALATIYSLKNDSRIDWKIFWIGPNRALESSRVKPFETGLFPTLGVKVLHITAGKLQSKFTRNTIPALLKFPIGLFQAFQKINQTKPDVVLSFGGFASFPVVFAAFINRIPVVIHEQTVAAGLANRLSSVFATKIALAREESIEYFPKARCVVVGNPLLPSILNVKPKGKLGVRPVIYITGGSRGSQRINRLVEDSLKSLLSKYRVIHQTGFIDFGRYKEVKASLPRDLSKYYEVFDFLTPTQIEEVQERADILIGRSGANTVSEVMAIGLPSIFIPIPWSRMDEQSKNAAFAQKHGVAKVLHERDASPKALLQIIKDTIADYREMSNHINRFEFDRSASMNLVNLLHSVI